MPRPLAFDPDDALERAMELFWRQGYEATGLAELTAVMGINRPSLYNTFGDKRSLYLAALERYRERYGSQATAELEAGLGAAPAEGSERARAVRAAFARFFTALIEGEQAAWGCMVANAATETAPADSAVCAIVQNAAATNEALFADAIRHAQARGEIAPAKDPEALARTLYNAVLALQVRARSGESRESLRANVAATLALLD